MSDNNETIVNEKLRTYHWIFGDNRRHTQYVDIVSVRVSSSGNHYLRLKSGDLVIVKSTWDYIEIVPKTPETGWTF